MIKKYRTTARICKETLGQGQSNIDHVKGDMAKKIGIMMLKDGSIDIDEKCDYTDGSIAIEMSALAVNKADIKEIIRTAFELGRRNTYDGQDDDLRQLIINFLNNTKL